MRWAVLDGVLSVLVACQLNVYYLEHVMSDPFGRRFASGLTLLQFVLVTCLSACLLLQRDPSSWIGLRVRPFQVPASHRMLLAVVFFLTNLTNNLAFQFNVSIPVHTVFRSSSLILTMTMGYALRGEQYTLLQILSAATITIGVVWLTLLKNPPSKSSDPGLETDTLTWWMGVGMLSLTTSLSALLGIVQGWVVSTATGRHKEMVSGELWRETLFSAHAFALPLFILSDIVTGNASASSVASVYDVPPRLVYYIAGNVVSQFVCIRGVYVLVSHTSPFTTVLITTTRKFLSLVGSIVVFGHWETLTIQHFVCMTSVMVAASVYPFLPAANKRPHALASHSIEKRRMKEA